MGIAESLTGGEVASTIVSVPGASDVLLGGIVAYATELKHRLLGVDAQLLEEHGAVHPEVARQMAVGVRSAVSVGGVAASVGISTTGVAGPDAADGMPVGTVYVGVSAPGVDAAYPFTFVGSRAEIRAQATDAAIEAAIRVLTGEGVRE